MQFFKYLSVLTTKPKNHTVNWFIQIKLPFIAKKSVLLHPES